ETAELREQKLRRNLRLLELDFAEKPDDLIVAFNLASTYQQADQPLRALPLLERCRRELPVRSSMAARAYLLLGKVEYRLGREEAARVKKGVTERACAIKGASVTKGDSGVAKG